MPATEPSRRRRKDERPHELIEAAMALFVERGFAATRSEEVASRAGVSKGTLYLYFPSKADLFKAVVRTHLTAPIVEAQAFADSFAGPSAELLEKLILMIWERVGTTAAGSICKVVMAEARNFPEVALFYVNEVIEPTHRLLASVLRRGIAREEFREIPVESAIPALIAPSLLLAMHKHSVGACPLCDEAAFVDEDAIHTQIDLILRGLQAPATAACASQLPSSGTS